MTNTEISNLEVTPQNTRARDFYARLGFKTHKNSMFRLEQFYKIVK